MRSQNPDPQFLDILRRKYRLSFVFSYSVFLEIVEKIKNSGSYGKESKPPKFLESVNTKNR